MFNGRLDNDLNQAENLVKNNTSNSDNGRYLETNLMKHRSKKLDCDEVNNYFIKIGFANLKITKISDPDFSHKDKIQIIRCKNENDESFEITRKVVEFYHVYVDNQQEHVSQRVKFKNVTMEPYNNILIVYDDGCMEIRFTC